MSAAELTPAPTRTPAHSPKAKSPTQTEPPAQENTPVDDKPRSVYEMITRQMLEDLKGDLAEVKGRVNALIWLVVGAVVADFVMRMIK